MERSGLTKDMRWQVADLMSEEILPQINGKLETVHPQNSFYLKYTKRVLDIILSACALIVALPINLVIGLITLFTVGFPLFFIQERLGKDGKLFKVIKFRNMRNTRDARGELLPPAQRVTKIGKFIRKTSLDELMNFWSVFKGDMSLIGPRPLVPEYYTRFNSRHIHRLDVRPGLECPPRSLNGRVWTWQDQFENDIWYVENVSFATDCKMVINMLRFMFDKKSVEARAVAARGIFMGYDLDGNAINLEMVPQEYISRVCKTKQEVSV